MLRPPPVTLTMTCGARLTTVASMRWRMAAACAVNLRALRIQPGLRPDLDDAVARVEQAIAPGDEDAIERWAVWGIGTVRVTLHVAREVGRRVPDGVFMGGSFGCWVGCGQRVLRW
ncbi:hypothetical protein Y695_00853 [Hydrogenophaga sp. T4]|nr:hypothetical protein Y695_00853 [Hydrogenophaga sp. T4]